MASKLKKNDSVIILAGKDKGKTGKILKVLPNSKVLVEGIQLVKKHSKGNPQKNIEGGIISKESPIAVSNVAILNALTNKSDKVGFKILEDGKKVRIYKSSGEQI